MSTRGTALRNTLFSSVGLYTEYGLGVLASIIIARELGPNDYGVYVVVVWLAGLAVAAINSGTASAAIKFIAELRGAGDEQRIATLVSFLRRIEHAFFAVIMVLGGVLFALRGEDYSGAMNPWLVLGLIAAAVVLRAPYMFDIGVCKGFENFAGTARIAAVATPINLLLMIAAWLLHLPVLGFLAAYVLAGVVFRFMSHREVARMLGPLDRNADLSPELRRRVWRHVRIAAMTVTVTFISARDIEVMFLTQYASAADAGYYKVAYQLATGAALLAPGVFGAILLPMMASALSRGGDIAARRFVASSSYLILLAAPLMVFGLLFAGDVITFLYGEAYAAAGPVLSILIVVCCYGSLGAASSSLLVSADRQHNILFVTLAIGVLKLVLNWWLIRAYGLHGAVWASAISGVVGTTAVLALAMASVRTALDWGRIARILLAAAVAGGVAWLVPSNLPALAFIVLGTGVLMLVYALATIGFGCWDRGDLEYLLSWRDRAPRVLQPLFGPFAWALVRARENER